MDASSASCPTRPRVSVCDDAAVVVEAIKALQPYSCIACDCEGLSLGEMGGSLSLIALGGIPASEADSIQVYLFDAIKLGKDGLQPVFELLRSPGHKKIVFDGRMDWSELYHRYGGVELAPVLDLQLADVESRAVRGGGEDEQLARLSPYCHRNEVQSQRNSYRLVHRLSGLSGCLAEHGVSADAKLSKSAKSFNHSVWDRRPLTQGCAEYAAMDITLIAQLYTAFVAKGYVDEAKLLEQSARYVSLNKDGLPRAGGGHSLLPLEITSVPSLFESRLTCNKCSRVLSDICFSKTGRRLVKQRYCWVCRAVNVHDARQEAICRNYDSDY
ncbi:uncharacterized protein PHACADRAFT_127582 [Phanerochaete carnosa HHB-10118-sp]|uniref:3'-5' exonuclease domain-containing protein n=1 Tax=Phanerochaete carnosa (strain HHB-10118-sp) TaxID=650164 RepID=K5WN46_PHACS|nr:uncharacterized protein PHACADRAFT_127582 [Phanerochaete carnosa HHB-10118-sp]EKM51747.1 hypothetical protein PHACADRAFT_127582 [Phanerochaete carnosa HHB-10118-sp]